MKKNISIKDVAETAGVSTSAVSAVLNNKIGKSIRVGKETKTKILETARSMGYVPNPTAQNLASGRSHIVSVFTYETIFPFTAENEFFSFLLGIENQAGQSGYDILLITNKRISSDMSLHNEADLNRLKLGDGGILFGIKRHTKTIIRLIDDGFPLVFIGRRDFEEREVNIVNYDYNSIIQKLVTLAYQSEYRKSVYIKLEGNREPYEDRQKALDSAVANTEDFTNETIILKQDEITLSWVKQIIESGVTLLVLERKSLALKLEAVCMEGDIQIGKDISVILFEDQWFSSGLKWTCWSNVRNSLGKKALSLLDEIITKKNEAPITALIEPEIVIGETLFTNYHPLA